MRTVATLVAMLLCLAAFDAKAENTWVAVSSSDGSAAEARHESAFTAVGDQLLLAGGRGIKAVDIFDPLLGRWQQGAKPPIEVHHFQAIDYEGELWVVGAFTGGYPDETPLPHVLIYDPDEDRWRQGPEIPEDRRRGSAGAVLVDGAIYVAGGAQEGHRGGHVAWLDRLDPESGAWTRLADAPRARDHAALVTLDGKLVFAGGRRSMAPHNTFGAVVPEVDVYDIARDRWTTLAEPLPTPRAGNAAVAFDGSVLVIGGESGASAAAHAEVERLDPETGTWHSEPSLLQARHGTGATVFDDSVWIAAGSGARGGAPELSSMERLQR